MTVVYAAFANGSIGIPEESRLQVGGRGVALATLAGLLYGSGLRVAATPAAGWGVALLVAFAGWAALSITWSVAPDESWLEANRALSYALVAGLGIVLGSSLPRAAERVALVLLAIATVIAAYALAGKLFPVAARRRPDRPEPRRPLLAPAGAAGLLERARPGVRGRRADRHARGHRAALPARWRGSRRPWR